MSGSSACGEDSAHFKGFYLRGKTQTRESQDVMAEKDLNLIVHLTVDEVH